jgi:two-component system cell cycle response regulator CtrA
MRVLLIEDDELVAASVEAMLKSENIHAYISDLGEDAIELAKFYDYDAIILDLDLPDMPGMAVLRQLRVNKIRTPVIVMSGTTSLETKVQAFAVGADDYLIKPTPKSELVARLRAVVRRSKGHAWSMIRTGDITVDLDSKTADINGQPLSLSGKEYQILELLCLRKGSTLTKEVFLNHLYNGVDEEPEPKIIDVFVCKLRKKLSAISNGKQHIETVWGKGYLIRDEERAATNVAA